LSGDFLGIPGLSFVSVISLLCFIPAIVLHEVAHGFMAHKLGDPTAKSQGRLSLNPLRHVDPFGTVVLPLLLFIAGGPIFGYAKPVPYNPRYFKNLRKGELLTGLAGPAANLILGLLGVMAAFAFYTVFSVGVRSTAWLDIALDICYIFTMINFCLMFFNLLPIPPLDGSSVIAVFLNNKQLSSYYRLQQYALPVLMVLMIAVPYVLHFSPIGIYIDFTAGNLTRFLFDLIFMF
jgi:Zn-dependent protease